jgi:hypothetical protein
VGAELFNAESTVGQTDMAKRVVALRSLANTMYLRVLCGSQNKQPLFPYTALTDWFYNRNGVCLLRGTI